MTRFQIYLDETQVQLIDLFAAKKRTTRSQVIRDMISKQTRKMPKKTSRNPLLKMAGMFKGLPKNLSQRVDEIYHTD